MRSTKSLSNAERPGVLLVYDCQQGINARKAILEDNGFRVTVARTDADVSITALAEEYRLIVINHQPPALDGIALIQRLRESDTRAGLILISGLADTLGLTEANTRADVVIQKNSNEVSNLVRSATRLTRKKAARKPPVRLENRSAVAAGEGLS